MKGKARISLRVEIPNVIRSMIESHRKSQKKRSCMNMSKGSVKVYPPCKYNKGVECAARDDAKCAKCGWNPEVTKMRKANIDLEKLMAIAASKPRRYVAMEKYYKPRMHGVKNGGGRS